MNFPKKVKKLFNCLGSDMNKAILSYGFLLCIGVTFLLCFTASVYTNNSGKEFSSIEILIEKEKYKSFSLTYTQILNNSLSPYLTLFLPVLSSIPFVTYFCAERVGSMRFSITRTGKYIYCVSKFISALLSSGLAVMLGFILYSLVIILNFPPENVVFPDIVKMYIGMGLYGMVSVLPAFFLSSFIKNKYMICCFPFIFMYFYYTIVSKIQDMLRANEKYEILTKIIFLYPNELKNIFITHNTDVVLYNAILSAVTIIGFTLIMNRRFDCGQ